MATIDVGIDLGTTNSAIALVQRGQPFVVPNFLGEQTTPSVVHMDPAGTVTVGRRAYERLVRDPEHTAAEFKRVMGQSAAQVLPTRTVAESGTPVSPQLTPPELSAEVLKSLLADLQRYAGVRAEGAVITVPAAFDLTQCAATEEAARLAGLRQVHLLQEPIAASLAFGYRVDLTDREWLVFDLGGGTFDLALIGVRDGVIEVIDHEGDNHLGGKNFDWALLEGVVLPRIAERFSVESYTRDNPARRVDLAVLKALCEEAKKELSIHESATITVEMRPGQLVDDTGVDINIDVPVSRIEYERVIVDTVLRAAQIGREVVDRNPEARPQAVLMVGGPTLTPLVRTVVAQVLGLRVDSSVNPFTAVAEGAAWYAATQPLEVATEVEAATASGAIEVRLDYKQVTDDDTVLVGVMHTPGVAGVQFIARDRSWSSGRVDVATGAAIVRLPLASSGLHVFAVEAYDDNGLILDSTPAEITITRGLTARAAPLSKTLGVVRSGADGVPQFDVLLSRGTALPARGVKEYRTTVAVEPGSDEAAVTIHVQEGRSENPYRNRKVGEIIVSGRHIDRRLPIGIPVEVTLEVSESRLLRASAYISMLDLIFEASIDLSDEEVSIPTLVGQLFEERQRFQSLAPHIAADDQRALTEALDRVDRELRAARGGDADSYMAAFRQLQAVQDELDRVERAQELPMAMAEAREEAELAATVVSQYGDAGHRARHQALAADLDRAGELRSVFDIRRATRRFTELRWEILFDQRGVWVDLFRHLADDVQGWTDAGLADTLRQRGELELRSEDWGALQRTTREMYALMSAEARARDPYGRIGIA